MKKLICDICEQEVTETLAVEVLDGEHPHNGSIIHKDIDVCFNCILYIPNLSSSVEFQDLRRANVEI